MTVGYTVGWTAPVIPKLQDPDQSPLPGSITENQMSFVGTILYLGGVPGPYLTGYLANRKGRKPCLLLGGVVTAVGYIVLATAINLLMMYIGRALVGFGVAIITVMTLVYLGEIASTNIRGILLTGSGIFQTFGTLLVYSIGPYVRYSLTGYIGAILAALYCFGIFFIPETPLGYILRDNEKAAKEVLQDLGRPNDLEEVKILKDEEINKNIKDEWIKIFTIKSNRKALLIAVTLNVLQQSSGIIAVVFFTTTIFELAGSSIKPDIATIIIGITQLLASFVAPIFVERNGRRILLLLSTAFCCFALVILGLFFYLDEIDHSSVDNLKWLPLVSLICFFLSYDVGFSIIPVALIGELFTSNVRSTGSAVTITIGWLFGFGVTTGFGFFITILGGHITFWMFSGVCALAFIFTLVYVPETKFKSFIEIQEMLSK
ncbi:facilitated trehalose transporter Tret1-like [Epargyreus clarus]|uniref:facilitated trehalose transporter Tret1-like n=1 Tax=Epargyreus clarus TaxID=520877 RepID=UPI003C2C208B